MPGKKITDQQVRKYKEARRQATQQIAAARMGISVRSARRIEQADGLPSQRGPRTWRTRADPLADAWEQELVPLLEREPGLQGRTLLEELQRRHGDVFGDGVLRTLQRRIRMWRASMRGLRGSSSSLSCSISLAPVSRISNALRGSVRDRADES